VAPGGEAVAPGLDDELVPADLVGGDGGVPVVVDLVLHRGALPLRAADPPPPDPGGETVVAVLEDVGGDGDGLADHRLGGEAGRRGRANGVDRDASEHT
jgi:hypothetical protein